jgi:hypothetical protein
VPSLSWEREKNSQREWENESWKKREREQPVCAHYITGGCSILDLLARLSGGKNKIYSEACGAWDLFKLIKFINFKFVNKIQKEEFTYRKFQKEACQKIWRNLFGDSFQLPQKGSIFSHFE